MLYLKSFRSLEYYAISGQRKPLHHLVVGYVVDEVPQVILDYLYGVLDEAIGKVDNFDADAEVEEEEEEEGETREVEELERDSVGRAGVSERYPDRGHDIVGGDRDDGGYGNEDYDSVELIACKRNKKNCKKKKGLGKKNKKGIRAHRRRHREAISFPAESSGKNPRDRSESIPVKNVRGGSQGNMAVGLDIGGDIGDSDGLGGDSDTFVDGNVNNQNMDGSGSTFNDENESDGPGLYIDDNVKSSNPNGGNGVYSDANLNYDTNGVSVFQERNNGNSNSGDGMYTAKNDNNSGRGVRNMSYGNYSMQNNNNNNRRHILPSEDIKSQNQTRPTINI